MTSLGVAFADDALEARVSRGVQLVEEHLARVVDSDEQFITEAAAHLLNAGGKRFRPMLVMVCAEFGDPAHPDVVPAGTAVELTHLATLYHDDVMDEASMRRGAESANHRWDNSLAILVGDYLFAHASEVVSTLGPDAVGVQARTFARLVKGQIRETIGPRGDEDPLAHYLSVVADKTGSLIATSAHFGATMSRASDDVVAALTEFGERIGVAFQLSDDILDITSDSGESGKTPGTDLREGVPTLPVLLARRSTDPADADLVNLLNAPITDDAEVTRAARGVAGPPGDERGSRRGAGRGRRGARPARQAARHARPCSPERDLRHPGHASQLTAGTSQGLSR